MTVRLAAALLAMITLAACGGDGVVSEPPVAGGPTLSSLQASIFTPNCAVSGCHLNPGAEQGMDLSAGKFYANTVGVESNEQPAYKRVAPGNAADSYLYMKVAADPRITGAQMPFGGMLTAAEVEAIRQWIDDGALNN